MPFLPPFPGELDAGLAPALWAAGDLTSGPHAWASSVLPTDSFPLPSLALLHVAPDFQLLLTLGPSQSSDVSDFPLLKPLSVFSEVWLW